MMARTLDWWAVLFVSFWTAANALALVVQADIPSPDAAVAAYAATSANTRGTLLVLALVVVLLALADLAASVWLIGRLVFAGAHRIVLVGALLLCAASVWMLTTVSPGWRETTGFWPLFDACVLTLFVATRRSA